METTKANGSNTYAYMHHLLHYIPDASYLNNSEVLEGLILWTELVKGE
ncbi:hypothetical protein ACIZ62_06015 [Acetobacterium carbinolicum]